MFLWNILLALTWTALGGEFRLSALATGMGLGYLLLWLLQPALGPSPYVQKVSHSIRFFSFYLWKLILANARVAYDVVTPRHYMRPGVIAVPLDARTDAEITLLANLMTLTPGTLSLDISADRRVLFLHAMYIDDLDMLRREIKVDFERRVLELLR
jgi:multicomponent Na+:H+ antiporter subunit E